MQRNCEKYLHTLNISQYSYAKIEVKKNICQKTTCHEMANIDGQAVSHEK